jgi:DNA-binding GntR family transcriptional regulator
MMATLTEKVQGLDFKATGLVDRVSETLSQAILEGVLKGGDQLVEVNLQGQFGISRSPLREAFRDLEKKGLVVIVPRRGTFVKTVTRKDIEDNFPVRACLEGLAAKMAFKNMTEKHFKALAQTLQNMGASADDGDARAFMEHHLNFHEIFIEASENDVLIRILENLRMHSVWYRFCYQYYKEDFRKSMAIHGRILDLFRNREADPKLIEDTVKRHIEAGLERFLVYLEEQE